MKNIHVLPTDKSSKLYYNTKGKNYAFSNTILSQGGCVENQHIYITSDEEIKEGNAYLTKNGEICKSHNGSKILLFNTDKKIILTTDVDLIKNGVQAIDDEFLEWFVKNPSCEYVDLIGLRKEKEYEFLGYEIIIPTEEPYERTIQSISLSEVDKEEPKQETFVNEKCFKCGRSQYSSRKPFCTDDFCNKDFYQKPKQETLEEAAENYSKITLNKQGLMSDKQINGFIAGAKWQAERMYSEDEVGELLYNIIGQYGKHYGIMIDGKVLNDLFEQFKKK